MGIEGYYEDYFDERQEEKLTNFQKIKQMSLDEMADFILYHNNRHECCAINYDLTKDCAKYSCKDGIKLWLQKESEE